MKYFWTFFSMVSALILIFISCSSPPPPPPKVEEGFDVIKFLDSKSELTNEDWGLVFDTLTKLDKENNSKAMQTLVDLIDYGLDGANGEMLAESITKKGKAILPYLCKKSIMPSKCVNKPFCTSEKERQSEINWYISSMNNGIVLYSVYPDDINKITRFDMELINIMIQKFEADNKRPPNSLDELKKYCWTNYYYDLRIYDPTGKEYIYTIQDGKASVTSELLKWN